MDLPGESPNNHQCDSGKLTDRFIETTSPSAIKAYETTLEKLEAEKALIAENLTKKPDIKQDFD